MKVVVHNIANYNPWPQPWTWRGDTTKKYLKEPATSLALLWIFEIMVKISTQYLLDSRSQDSYQRLIDSAA